MFIISIKIIAGFIFLTLGAEWFVKGAVRIGKLAKISPIIIGLTIVAFGTSAPELMVSILSVMRGEYGLSLGNIVGSNIINILLCFGIVAVIYPIKTNFTIVKNELLFLIFVTCIIVYLMFGGIITQIQGIALITFLTLYIIYLVIASKKYHKKNLVASAMEAELESELESDLHISKQMSILKNVGLLAIGLPTLLFSSHILIDGAIDLALILEVPQVVIGLTIIAIGTSLPEIATCIIAARRKHTGLILGGIIGSNIYNTLLITGTAATISPLTVDTQLINFDMWVMLGATLILLPILYFFGKINRLIGICFLVCYALYAFVQYYSF